MSLLHAVKHGKVTVLLDKSGYKTLVTDLVLEPGLLETVERSGTSSGT